MSLTKIVINGYVLLLQSVLIDNFQ